MSIGWHARSEWPARRSRMLVTDPTSGTARGQPYAAALMNSHERPRYAEHELERGMRRPPGEDRVSNLLATNPLLVTRNAMWRDENRTRRQPSPRYVPAGLPPARILLGPSVARSQPNRPLTQAACVSRKLLLISIDQTFVVFVSVDDLPPGRHDREVDRKLPGPQPERAGYSEGDERQSQRDRPSQLRLDPAERAGRPRAPGRDTRRAEVGEPGIRESAVHRDKGQSRGDLGRDRFRHRRRPSQYPGRGLPAAECGGMEQRKRAGLLHLLGRHHERQESVQAL